MDVRLLGPLEVHAGGRAVPVRGPKQRALLAFLALEPDRAVPTSRILEAIWDEPPESGPKALQMCVSALRKTLPSDVLETAPSGYRLRIDPLGVDVHRFERMVSEAHGMLASEPGPAGALLREALALWRGPALAEFVAERFAAAEAARLEALRQEALVLRIEADLALDHGADLVPELERLVVEHPLRERLRGQLMLALYRGGRQADALAAYREMRETLVEELGIEPGPELQRLHAAILQQLPELDVFERIAAGSAPQRPPRDEPELIPEERKLVTALFADLADSTALGERLDPERLRVVLGDYFRAMSRVIERWGGTLEKFIGDAVMAVFGVPVMHEDDAGRALSAALEMLDRLEELNASLSDRHRVALALKIGINTGDVVAGGPMGHFMVTGDAVNTAARLQQAAEPGEILVGERTHRAARYGFAFAERGELELKGKEARVRAFRLVGARMPGPSGRASFSSRLVGRERELVLLETLSRAAVEDGRPELVIVAGPAGIGKTRLVEEFLARAPGTVLRGRCLSYGEGITYWALREIVWSAAGILLDDDAATAASKLRALVTGLGPLTPEERTRVHFALGVTAGLTDPGEPVAAVSPEAVHAELTLAWPLFVTALAAGGPLVLVVEDVHWAEPPLLDMLDRLAARAAGPVLIVATSRPDAELASLRSRPGGSNQVSLEPLGDRQARLLLGELLPDVPGAPTETILDAAEGNPLFLEELARHVVERGADEGAAVELPDSIRGLLAARIDALPPAQKSVLQEAAVIGKVFWATAVEAVRGGDARAELAALEARGLVVTRPSSQLGGQSEVAFRHALIREAAYQSIPRARRAPAHAATADWVASLAGDRRDEFVELIAHHAAAAAAPEDALLAWPDDPDARESRRRVAVAALVAAGSAARGRFGLEEASRFADRAHSLAALDEEHLEILALRADVAHAAVRVSDAWSLYLEALALAERLGDRARGARLAANATLLWSRYFGAFPDTEWHEAAAEMVRTWLDRLGESSESFETGALLVGRSMFEFDQIQARAGEEAIADAERALAVADRIGSPRLLSYAVDAVTMLMAVDGLCSAANAGRLAAGTRARVPDRWSAHEMLINAAHLHAAAGELDRAMELATEAAHEAATLSTHQRIHAAAAQAYTLAQAGRLAELREATAAVPDLIEEEDRTACYHGLVALAAQVLAAHELGDADAAARTLTLTDEVTSAGPDPLGERLRALELVLRVRGVEESGRLLASHPSPFGRTASMRRLRAALQIAALAGDTATVDELAPEGVALATAACAPALASIADWAASLAAGDLPGAERAALGLVGERYLSARLLADLVGFAPRVERERLAEEAASRLEALGAVTSAGEVRTLASAVS